MFIFGTFLTQHLRRSVAKKTLFFSLLENLQVLVEHNLGRSSAAAAAALTFSIPPPKFLYTRFAPHRFRDAREKYFYFFYLFFFSIFFPPPLMILLNRCQFNTLLCFTKCYRPAHVRCNLLENHPRTGNKRILFNRLVRVHRLLEHHLCIEPQ